MGKKSTVFICQNCGHQQSSWSGRCLNCSEWSTIVEQISLSNKVVKSSGKVLDAVNISKKNSDKSDHRILTNDLQLDSVLGGGLVEGSVVLFAGEPGIGKSTLMLQIANSVSKSHKILYVSGEESVNQITSRARRLQYIDSKIDYVSSNSCDDIAETILSGKYDVVIVDSIQTVACESVGSIQGSISQITNSANMLTKTAKLSNTTLLIIGHVTKEGAIAGPKLLEHTVDVILQFEGDRYGGFKVLRSVKNRYGSTNESALYEMKDTGLVSVENPSAALLRERRVTDGSIVLATLEGSRAVLVEIQALVIGTKFGYPKRASSGFDLNRLNLLVAMLEKRTKLSLSDKDIYINVVGGLKLEDPAADLAVCMAIASATKSMKLKQNAVVFGELGLSGEVRHVQFMEKRIEESAKMGFEIAVGPLSKNLKLNNYFGVDTVREALNQFLSR